MSTPLLPIIAGIGLVLASPHRAEAAPTDPPVFRAGAATRTFSSTRREERRTGGAMQTVFTFPDAAFEAMLALDPRESVVIELLGARTTERIYVEVGDIAAARRFLTLRAD